MILATKPHIYLSPHGWTFYRACTLFTTESEREERTRRNSLAAAAVRRLTYGKPLSDLQEDLLP